MNRHSNVFDLALYILRSEGEMTTMRLQKLVYYCQAHALVWDEEPIFYENIEAWANGPVVRELFNAHRGMYRVNQNHFLRKGNVKNISYGHSRTIDVILEAYRNEPTQLLTEETHKEDVFIKARKGLEPLDRGDRVMELADIAFYYNSVLANEQTDKKESSEENEEWWMEP